MEKTSQTNDFLVLKGPSNGDVGVAMGTVFQEIRAGAAFETGDFVKKSWGGGGLP